jgi:hypothetical protein
MRKPSFFCSGCKCSAVNKADRNGPIKKNAIFVPYLDEDGCFRRGGLKKTGERNALKFMKVLFNRLVMRLPSMRGGRLVELFGPKGTWGAHGKRGTNAQVSVQSQELVLRSSLLPDPLSGH